MFIAIEGNAEFRVGVLRGDTPKLLVLVIVAQSGEVLKFVDVTAR